MLLEPAKYNDVIIGNDFTVCNLCASAKAHEEHCMTSKAIRELQGSFVGKYCLKVGDIFICEDCLSKALADIAIKKKKTQDYKKSLGDDIIESLTEESAKEEKPKTTRGRKKVTEE
jgi:hypothetical protein